MSIASDAKKTTWRKKKVWHLLIILLYFQLNLWTCLRTLNNYIHKLIMLLYLQLKHWTCWRTLNQTTSKKPSKICHHKWRAWWREWVRYNILFSLSYVPFVFLIELRSFLHFIELHSLPPFFFSLNYVPFLLLRELYPFLFLLSYIPFLFFFFF